MDVQAATFLHPIVSEGSGGRRVTLRRRIVRLGQNARGDFDVGGEVLEQNIGDEEVPGTRVAERDRECRRLAGNLSDEADCFPIEAAVADVMRLVPQRLAV